MTFGPSHYVPVLKVKRGEKSALQLVAPKLRAEITPLLEIVEWHGSTRKPTLSSHLDTAFRDLAKSLRLYPRCFLDARELEPEGKAAADEVFDRAAREGTTVHPGHRALAHVGRIGSPETWQSRIGHPVDSRRVRGR